MQKYLLGLSLIILSALPTTSAYAQGPEVSEAKNVAPGYPAPMKGMPQDFGAQGQTPPPLSPEELASWEKEMTNEINQFVGTLSPEEQAQFHKDVDELTQIMSNMSEKELLEFMGQMFPEEGGMELPPVQEQPVIPVTEIKEEPIVKVVEPQVASNTIDAAKKLIEDILMHTERFLRKAQMIPELPGKIESWVEKNKLKEWKADVTWELLKGKLEQLNQRLHSLLAIDPKSKKYKYLPYLAQEESLNNNLVQFKTSLHNHEPKVEAPAFGLGKVTASSRTAIKETLSTFAEALYKLDLIAEIDKVIEKYEPRAKELRETEEAAQKRALEESKRPRFEGARQETTPAGRGGGFGSGRGYDDYDPAGRGAYDYPSYPGADSYGDDDFNRYPLRDDARPDGAPSEGATPPAGADAQDKDKKTAADAAAKKEEAGTAGAPSAQMDDLTRRSVGKIESSFDEFIKTVKNSKLEKIYAHMIDGSAVDNELKDTHLPYAISTLKNRVVDAIKKITSKRNLAGGPQQDDQALKYLRAIAGDHKKTIDELIHQLTIIKTGSPDIKENKRKEYAEKLNELLDLLNQFNSELGDYGAPSKAVALPTAEQDEQAPAKGKAARAAQQAPAKMQAEQEAVAAQEGVPAQARVALPDDVKRIIKRVDTSLENANKIISSTPLLLNIQAHIVDVTPPLQAELEEVRTAIKSVTQELSYAHTILTQAQKRFAELPQAQKKAAQEQLVAYMEEYSATFEPLLKQIAAIQAMDLDALSFFKLFAYLNRSYTQEEVQKSDGNAANAKIYTNFLRNFQPASLAALSDAYAALQKAVGAL